MNYRTFNGIFFHLNEFWAAKVLNMQMNPAPGIDLLDDKKDVEIAFAQQIPGKYNHKSWRKLNHEVEWGKREKPIYWGFGFYYLNDEIKYIRVIRNNLVTRRKLFIVPWGWIYQFESYHHAGETNKSKWDYWIRFPKYRPLPSVIESYEVEGGLVHFTKGVNCGLFNIQGKRLEILPS